MLNNQFLFAIFQQEMRMILFGEHIVNELLFVFSRTFFVAWNVFITLGIFAITDMKK